MESPTTLAGTVGLPPSERLDDFVALLRTPGQPDEVIETPCTLPAGVAPLSRRVLFDSRTLEIAIPSRRAVAGFVVGSLLVAGVIAFVWIVIAA